VVQRSYHSLTHSHYFIINIKDESIQERGIKPFSNSHNSLFIINFILCSGEGELLSEQFQNYYFIYFSK